jgi:hypothetical protein
VFQAATESRPEGLAAKRRVMVAVAVAVAVRSPIPAAQAVMASKDIV